MGENSKIAWTDHTFNPWTRCSKVSPACDHCYAETWAGRATHPRDAAGKALPIWGPDAPRAPTSEHNWKQPIRWNREAHATGRRARVFCASLADVFEEHPAITASGARERLWELVWATPWLDWLLLTKRPENMLRFAPGAWRETWPTNVWAGTTVEAQRYADERIPHLLKVPARVRFLSVEPMLEPIDFRWALCAGDGAVGGAAGLHTGPGVSWVICGGESHRSPLKARALDLSWARSLRDQCSDAGVPFFMKQLGATPHQSGADAERFGSLEEMSDSAGTDPAEWPSDLRIQEFPS